ncbi:MAG: general secretion pathway protein GspM [Ideonella sp. MAG2]|nr:MAG: general secretion pathway protein GspM [Ideonella sp. MAG2]
MSEPTTSSAPGLAQRWQALNDRERQLVLLAAAAVALLLIWLLVLKPTWTVWRELPAKTAKVEDELLQLQLLASDAKDLKGQPAISPAQAQEAIKTATDRLGAHGKLTIAGDRATLTLTDAPPTQWRAWMAEARAGARARPISAQIQRGANGLQGQVVVSLPTAP